MAKRDAEFAIQLWPCWWRGYFRLGKAEHALGHLQQANFALKKALLLNSGSAEIRHELSVVDSKIGYQKREDYLNPEYLPNSYEIEHERTLKRLNMTEEEFLKMNDDTDATNGDKWRMGFQGQQDPHKAIAYYIKSANNGNSGSMLSLGKMYRNGEGVERNYEESIRWLRKAAESRSRPFKGNGIAEAQHLLGVSYHEGEGVKKNYSEALKWYEMAAKNGLAGSYNNLGVMYLYGHGVQISAQKAFEYFKSGSECGDTSAMQNLAELYFHANGTSSGIPTIKDNAEGIKWLKLAAKKGNQRAQKRLETVENMRYEELARDCLKDGDHIIIISNPMDQSLFSESIKEAKKKGSISAQRLLEIWKQLNIAIDAFKRNNSKELVAALSKAIRMDNQIVTFPDLFRPVIIERHKSHPDELDTITCYVRITINDENALKIVIEKLEIFAKDEFLLDMKVAAYLRLNDLKSALMASNKAIELYPTSPRIMYGHACVLFGQKPPMKEFIKFFDDFIAAAPNDHHRIPTCHYLKARYYHDNNELSNFKASYEAAIAAEKKQLPCFLPYDYEKKEVLKMLYAIQNYEENPSKIESLVCDPPAQFVLHESLDKVKANPRRKNLIIQNRQKFIHVHQTSKGYEYSPLSNCLPNVSKPPDVLSLKKIMLKDILLNGEKKIFEGFVLKARIIDWSLPMTSANVLIQDENGDVERTTISCSKYRNINIKREIEAVMKQFRPGVIVSIINPYLKEAGEDGQNVIRVENSSCLIIDDTDADERCSCCGRKSKVLLCSGCNGSRYCSKECQQYDWKELDHKSVCKALNTYNVSKK